MPRSSVSSETTTPSESREDRDQSRDLGTDRPLYMPGNSGHTAGANGDLVELLAELRRAGVPVSGRLAGLRALLDRVMTSLLLPWWSSRLKKVAACSEPHQLALSALLDRALKTCLLHDMSAASILIAAQIRLALRAGISEYTGRAVAYAGFFGIGGAGYFYRLVTRQVQLALRLTADSRAHTLREPLVGEWMGFLLPWTFPRRVTLRRIEQLLVTLKDGIDADLSRLSTEYELAANLFSTESISQVQQNLRHLERVGNGLAPDGRSAFHGNLSSEINRLIADQIRDGTQEESPSLDAPVFYNADSQNSLSLPSLFKESLRATNAALLRDQAELRRWNRLSRSLHSVSGSVAVVPPACLALITHATWMLLFRHRGGGVVARVHAVWQSLTVMRLARAEQNSLRWAYHLLLGEVAYSWGRKKLAFKHMRLARIKAKEAGQLLPLAYTQERLARFSLAESDHTLGRRQMKEARSLYELWGSTTKMRQIDAEFPYFRLSRVSQRPSDGGKPRDLSADITDGLDIASLARMSPKSDSELPLRDLVNLLAKAAPSGSAGSATDGGLAARVDRYVQGIRTQARHEVMGEIVHYLEGIVAQTDVANVPDYHVARCQSPSSRIGGDVAFFDFDVSNRCFYLGVLDVFGHGMEATVASSMASGAILAAFDHLKRLSELNERERLKVLARALEAVAQQVAEPDGRLIKATMIVVELDSGRGACLLAGNPPAYMRLGDEIKTIGRGTGPLGRNEGDLASRIADFELEPDANLMICTDGLTKSLKLTGQSVRKVMLRAQMPEALAEELVLSIQGSEDQSEASAAFILLGRRK